MSLAAPLWLLAGALALLVVFLHAMRHNHVEVPSIILWRKLAATSRPARTLRPPRWSTLLLLQVLAVLALALALAEPAFGPGAGRPLHEIYVLDASAGMRATDVAPSRFDAALADLISELPNRGEGSRITVAVAGGEPQLLFARQAEGEALVETVRALTAGDGTADWFDLSRKLSGTVRADEDTHVVVWTSGEGDPAQTLRTALPGAEVETRIIGDAQVPNAAVRGSITAVANAPGKWLLRAEIALHEMAAPPVIALRFQKAGGGGFLDWRTVTPRLAEDGRSALVEEEIDLPADGTLVLSLPADLQSSDNTFGLLVRSVPSRIRAIYVGAGNRPLQLALLARQDVDLFSATSLPPDADQYDLVVADNVVLPRKPATNVLWIGSARSEGDAEPVVVTTKPTGWAAAHPLSDDLDWSTVGSGDALAGPAMPGSEVILAAAGGPLVAARTTPSGREVRLGLDLAPAGWAATPVLPIFISNLLDWIDADPAAVCIEGERCAFPARLVGQAVLDDNGEAVAGASLSEGDWLLDEANTFVPRRAGIYTIGGSVTRIVNAAPAVVAAPAAVTWADPPAGDHRPVQGALYLMLVVAGLLVVEAILAGRGPERFLRREGMVRGTPDARRRRWALGLRGAALLLLVAAMLAAPLLMPRQGNDTVLVTDAHEAIGDQRRAEVLAAVGSRTCTGFLPPSLGIVGLSSVPYIASDLSCGPDGATSSVGSGRGADIGAALELAAAMIRPGANGRVILASDGNDTGDGIETLLAGLRDRHIATDILPLTDRPSGDTIVTALETSGRPVEGDRLPIKVMINSDSGGPARVAITSDGAVVDEIDVTLDPGGNVVEASLPEVAAGRHVIEAAIVSADDPIPENNHVGLTLDVAPKASVAVVTPQAEWGDYFAQALALQGIEAQVISPADAPTNLGGWLGYSAVVLMNVPAIDLDSTQQDQLEQYVRIHGRGVLILGGENSFGPGGYYQTPLEAMSPLSARVPKDVPVAAMGFVLDRSGSMKAAVEGITRLDIAKSATVSAVELLNDESQVSVVVFDTQATLLVPMERKDVVAIREALMRVGPGGGTSIAPGLSEMLDQMKGSRKRVRHIVVMSDGLSQGGDFVALARTAHSRGITISAIAIGDGADIGRLEELAREGGGSFHATEDFRALPSILSQEAMMLSGESMEPGVRPVAWADRSAPFFDVLPAAMPEIESYVLTTAKPEARLHLMTTDNDGATVPILASWQYGNGTVLALATHGAGPGSVRWMGLPEYPLLWSQIIRSVLPTTSGPGMAITMESSGGKGLVVADVLDEDGEPVEGLAPLATVSRDGQPIGEPLHMQMTAPGRYTARFDAGEPGAYEAEVTAAGYAATSGLSVTYAPRLDFTRAKPDRLEALAAATGGRVLTGTEPLTTSSIVWEFHRVWRPWILLALAALLADLAVRYVPGVAPFLRDRVLRQPPSAQRAAV